LIIRQPDDPRVADYVRLTDADWRRRTEAEHGFFVAEGAFIVELVHRLGLRLRSVLASPARAEALVGRVAVDAPLYIAAPEVIDGITGFHAHRGLLAVVERPPPRDVANVVRGRGPLLLVEDVGDHENLGALFRNAAAFGAAGVVISPGCCEPLYRRAIRVSMGHVLTVPWARAHEWPVSVPGRTIVALTPEASATPITDAGLADAGPFALMVGAEGPGLSPAALATADRRVRIPMAAGVDSLNVATTAALALFVLATNSAP